MRFKTINTLTSKIIRTIRLNIIVTFMACKLKTKENLSSKSNNFTLKVWYGTISYIIKDVYLGNGITHLVLLLLLLT